METNILNWLVYCSTSVNNIIMTNKYCAENLSFLHNSRLHLVELWKQLIAIDEIPDCMQQVRFLLQTQNFWSTNMKPDNKNDNQVSLGFGAWEEEFSLITHVLSPEKFLSAPADCFWVLSGVQWIKSPLLAYLINEIKNFLCIMYQYIWKWKWMYNYQ